MGDNGQIKRVAAAALSAFDTIMGELGLSGGKTQGHEYLPLNPRRADSKPGSFAINRDTGAWSDFATDDKGGDLVALAAYIWGMKQGESAERLGKVLGISPPDRTKPPMGDSGNAIKPNASPVQHKPAGSKNNPPQPDCVMPAPAAAPTPPKTHPKHGKPSAFWAYLDSAGAVLFYHYRFDPKKAGERKQFSPLTLWRKESGALTWEWKRPPLPVPIFGLDRLSADPDATVCVVEGEKAADAAALLLPDHVVMCWQGGSQAVDKADWKPLAGRDVWLWADSDDPGRECMAKLAAILHSVGVKSARPVNLDKLTQTPGMDAEGKPILQPGNALEKGDDAADLLARGWTARHMEQAARQDGFLIDPPMAIQERHKEASKPPATTESQNPPKRKFVLDDRGLWLHGVDREGNPEAPRWLSAPLEVLALVRDPDNHGWGYLVFFLDHDRKPHREIIPARDFRGEGMEVADRLLDRGLAIAPKARPLLIEYLQTSKEKKRARVTTRTGWHDGGVFVLPDAAFGTNTEEWIFESDTPSANTFKSKGTLAGWRDNVSGLCRGNSRLLFSVSLAFATPLLHLAGAESGGFHLRSNSSDGKTTALRVAASVCGGPDYMQRWRATDNGLEALATQHCDSALLLDELAQLDPKAAGEVAYMLANGGGKTRSDRTGTKARARTSWRILFLSAGEIGLSQHMAEAGKSPRAGQELRLAEIPADAGAGLGVFEDLHELDNGSEFAKALDRLTRQNYGTAFPAFLEKLVANLDSLPEALHDAQKAFERKALTDGASGQAHRVASRFGLVGAAGELATNWGITGWSAGEAMGAAVSCFKAWLDGRGGEGKQEERAMLGQVREFLRRYGESAFTDWDRPAADTDTHASVRSDRAGFRRHIKEADELEYFIYPSTFQSRVCKGFDHSAVGRLLLQKGYIKPGTETDRPWLCKEKLPAEGRARVVHILPAIWEDE